MSQAVLRAWSVDSLEDRVMLLRKMVFDPHGGVRSPIMRRLGLLATRHCPPRSDACELRGIFDFVVRNVRYTGDVAGKDTFQSAIRTLQYGGGDCLPLSTLVLRDDYQLVPLSEVRAGTRIMADGRWTTVVEQWITGRKPILALELNNGSVLRCSPEHKLFRSGGQETRAERVHVGDYLLTPRQPVPVGGDRPPFSVRGLTHVDDAWLLGVYVADGWRESNRFAISGKDGKPKEEQKRRVQALMERAGINTRWHERYISVNDADLSGLLAVCGGHAPEKRLPSLAFSTREQVEAVLEGLRADAARAKSGTIVHGTTSPLLALQLRVLYRMLGQSTHIRKVNDHGGIGTHPIYRVTVRAPEGSYERKRSAVRAAARIVVIREDGRELCADVTTDTGALWLPESDTLVHNCDDHSILCATLAMENGFTCAFRITSNTGGSWDHIYCLAGVPKNRPVEWIALDTTLGPDRFGKEPRSVKRRDFKVAPGG